MDAEVGGASTGVCKLRISSDLIRIRACRFPKIKVVIYHADRPIKAIINRSRIVRENIVLPHHTCAGIRPDNHSDAVGIAGVVQELDVIDI